MEPWISIIVPVFNVENYLRRCVDSLINQSCPNLEIILVDDGSTDASGGICDEYSKKIANVRAVHKENGGLASARNEGLKYAHGEYVAFVDSDDWLEHETYRVLYEKCQEYYPDILNYGYQKVYGKRIIHREWAVFPEGVYDSNQIRSVILPDSIARQKAFDQVNLPVQLSACMCIYRRSFLIDNGFEFESERTVLSEDWLFNIACLCYAERMVILHDCFYNYYTRSTSLSQSYKKNAYECRCVLFQRYKEVLQHRGRENEQISERLRNFWLEAIYGCYIIELNAPTWNKDARTRLNMLCADPEFCTFAGMMNRHNCTLKGLVFCFIAKYRLHGIMRFVYGMKRKLQYLGK